MGTPCARNSGIVKPLSSEQVSYETINSNYDTIDASLAKGKWDATVDPAVTDDSGDGYAIGSLWVNTTGHKVFIAEAVTVGAAVWRQVWPALVADMTGLLKSDGSVTLSANWDAGAHEIRAETLEADVATGTAPLTIASTTKVTNLNADQVDGIDIPLTADVDFGSYQVKALKFESDQATGTAPFAVASTTKVANLNCDKLDDLEGAAYAILAGQSGGQTLKGGTGSGETLTLESTAHGTKGLINLKYACKLDGADYPAYSLKSQLSGALEWGFTASAGDLLIRDVTGGVNIIHIYNSGGMSLGSSVTDPGANNLYVTGDVNCASVTDHTPAYAGDAVAEIKAIKTKDGKIDHTSLPKFCQKKYTDSDEKEQIGRDLGATISILVEAVRQLTARIEKLEAGGKNGLRSH